MDRKLNDKSTSDEGRRPLAVPLRGTSSGLKRDWIDSFPKNIPESIIHKILNLRPIHPVAELLKPEFDLLMRDVDTDRYPIVKEGDIFKRFMSHARNCPRGFKCNCEYWRCGCDEGCIGCLGCGGFYDMDFDLPCECTGACFKCGYPYYGCDIDCEFIADLS